VPGHADRRRDGNRFHTDTSPKLQGGRSSDSRVTRTEGGLT